MTEQQRDLSLYEVLRQLRDTHRRLIELVNTVPGDQLRSETRFRRRLRLDTYGHYPKRELAKGNVERDGLFRSVAFFADESGEGGGTSSGSLTNLAVKPRRLRPGI